MQGISRSADRSRTGRRRPLPTLAALFAVLLQAFAVQTHVHVYTPLSAAAFVQASGGDAHAQHGDHASLTHAQTLCAVCQTLAASGAATLPPSANLTTAPAIAREAAAITPPDAPRVLAHSWQSRAPPTFL